MKRFHCGLVALAFSVAALALVGPAAAQGADEMNTLERQRFVQKQCPTEVQANKVYALSDEDWDAPAFEFRSKVNSLCRPGRIATVAPPPRLAPTTEVVPPPGTIPAPRRLTSASAAADPDADPAPPAESPQYEPAPQMEQRASHEPRRPGRGGPAYRSFDNVAEESLTHRSSSGKTYNLGNIGGNTQACTPPMQLVRSDRCTRTPDGRGVRCKFDCR